MAAWKNQYIDRLSTKPHLILNPSRGEPQPEELTKFNAVSSQFGELYVELGSGSGSHLITVASRNPGALYVGFELRYKRIFRTAEKAESLNLKNLFLLRVNARFISMFFSPSSLSGIYVNFPDPWDKRHWQKHRLLSQPYLAELSSLLKPGGFISYKTDHAKRFENTKIIIESLEEFRIARLSLDLTKSAYSAENVPTEFEQFFISKGSPIYFLEARKSAELKHLIFSSEHSNTGL